MGFRSSGRSNVLLSTSCAIPFAIVASMLLSSSLVGAVDILFCALHCGDPCLGCWNIAKEECCTSPPQGIGGASVDIKNADVPDVPASTKIYSGTPGSGCDDDDPVVVTGNHCVPTLYSRTSGALWYIEPPAQEPASQQPARRLQGVDLDIETSAKTIPTVYPNAAFFTEQGKEGHWVLPVSNFTEYISQVNDLSDGVTLDWFKSHGAFYNP